MYHIRAANIARKKMLSEFSNLPLNTTFTDILTKYLAGYPHYHIKRIINPWMLIYGFQWPHFINQVPIRADVLNRVLKYMVDNIGSIARYAICQIENDSWDIDSILRKLKDVSFDEQDAIRSILQQYCMDRPEESLIKLPIYSDCVTSFCNILDDHPHLLFELTPSNLAAIFNNSHITSFSPGVLANLNQLAPTLEDNVFIDVINRLNIFFTMKNVPNEFLQTLQNKASKFKTINFARMFQGVWRYLPELIEAMPLETCEEIQRLFAEHADASFIEEAIAKGISSLDEIIFSNLVRNISTEEKKQEQDKFYDSTDPSYAYLRNIVRGNGPIELAVRNRVATLDPAMLVDLIQLYNLQWLSSLQLSPQRLSALIPFLLKANDDNPQNKSLFFITLDIFLKTRTAEGERVVEAYMQSLIKLYDVFRILPQLADCLDSQPGNFHVLVETIPGLKALIHKYFPSGNPDQPYVIFEKIIHQIQSQDWYRKPSEVVKPLIADYEKLEQIGPDAGRLVASWHRVKTIYLQKMHPHATQLLNELIAQEDKENVSPLHIAYKYHQYTIVAVKNKIMMAFLTEFRDQFNVTPIEDRLGAIIVKYLKPYPSYHPDIVALPLMQGLMFSTDQTVRVLSILEKAGIFFQNQPDVPNKLSTFFSVAKPPIDNANAKENGLQPNNDACAVAVPPLVFAQPHR
ncbi:MAG: hypothetical protein K0Q74_1252 [Gammaproteobacteria bacterium]|nr:hypothetical protein [Gammaproteobacteria bacterium]